jgi:hypothetical protein
MEVLIIVLTIGRLFGANRLPQMVQEPSTDGPPGR